MVLVGVDAVLGVVLESQGSSPHIRECLIVWGMAALSQMVLAITKAADTVWRRICVLQPISAQLWWGTLMQGTCHSSETEDPERS